MAARRFIDVMERRARLGYRHRLTASERTDDVVRLTDDLVALHSTDPASVYLSAAARMEHPSFEPLEKALYEDHSLVRHHAMRRTLWVLSPAMARLAHASTTTGLLKAQRRLLITLLEQSGAVDDPESWLVAARADILAALRRLGPTTARRLGKEIPALGVKLHLSPGKSYGAEVAAHTRVLLLLGFEGETVRTRPMGSWISGEYNWAVADAWIDGGLSGWDPSEAASQMTRHWLRAFAPATAVDLQWWTGWTGAATRAALLRCGAVEVDLEDGTGWIDADDTSPVAASDSWVALLPSLDPSTMGWKHRSWYLSAELGRACFDRNGNGGPTIWVDGEIVGTWVQRPSGEIVVRVLTDVGDERRSAIDNRAHALHKLLGETRFRARFPAPIQATLLAT
jgi:hypothetical protein